MYSDDGLVSSSGVANYIVVSGVLPVCVQGEAAWLCSL